jgi:hypothetical protein
MGDDDESCTSTTDARSLSNDWKATVSPSLWRRNLAETLDDSNTCEYPDTVENPNQPGVTNTSWVLMQELAHTEVTSNWATYTSGMENPLSVRGMVIQLRVPAGRGRRPGGPSGRRCMAIPVSKAKCYWITALELGRDQHVATSEDHRSGHRNLAGCRHRMW